MTIAIIGGTGDQGFGLALRLGRAGEPIVIGSRSEERGAAAADKANQALRDAGTPPSIPVEGASNEAAAARGDVVVVTVPFAGQAEIYKSIRDHVRSDAVVCDCTSPLATAVGRPAWQVVTPWEGSAAEQAKAVLRTEVRMVAGFHTVSADQLQDLGRTLHGDVLVCGGDAEAKATIGALVEKIPDLRWVDAGPLSMARIVERMTAVLVSVNRAYGIHDAGIAVTGRDAWGRPPAKG